MLRTLVGVSYIYFIIVINHSKCTHQNAEIDISLFSFDMSFTFNKVMCDKTQLKFTSLNGPIQVNDDGCFYVMGHIFKTQMLLLAVDMCDMLNIQRY